MSIINDILTGTDGKTVAVGRWMGVILLMVGIGVILAEPISVVYKALSITDWGAMLSQWQVFLPILCATAGMLIAGTNFTEPKVKKDQEND